MNTDGRHQGIFLPRIVTTPAPQVWAPREGRVTVVVTVGVIDGAVVETANMIEMQMRRIRPDAGGWDHARGRYGRRVVRLG